MSDAEDINEITSRLKRFHRTLDPLFKTSAEEFVSDFRGDMSDEAIHDQVISLIYSVYHLKDHIITWARGNGRSSETVERTVNSSRALRLCADLANQDKHGRLKGKGRSKEYPQYGTVTRGLRPRDGKVVVERSANGRMLAQVSDRTPVIFSLEVVNSQGEVIGEAVEIAKQAMDDWRHLLSELGAVPDS